MLYLFHVLICVTRPCNVPGMLRRDLSRRFIIIIIMNYCESIIIIIIICSVLFFSRLRSERWPHHGSTYSTYLCHPVSLIDSSAGSPVHVLTLSI